MMRTHWCSSGCTQTGSTVAGSSGDERRNLDAEVVGSGLPAASSGDAPRVGGARADEPMGTAAEGANVRRGLNISAELPLDDRARDRAPGRGEHLDEDVSTVTPIVQRAEQAADAADAHTSVGKMEMISSAAARQRLTSLEHPCQGSQTSSQVTTSIQVPSLT